MREPTESSHQITDIIYLVYNLYGVIITKPLERGIFSSMPFFPSCDNLQVSSIILKDLSYHIPPYKESFVLRFYLPLKMLNYLIKVLSLIPLCVPYCAFYTLLVLSI